MARARYYDVTQFPDPSTGLIHKVSTVIITVYEQGTTTLLGESIFQADSGGSTYTNPRTITDGVVEFYLATEKRVSIKFDATASGYGTVTKDFENVWPEPSLLRTSMKSPNGLFVMSYDNDGILTAPGLLSKYKGWDLEVDGGLTPGQGMVNATANAALFQDLVDRVAALGGGDLMVKQEFALDPIHLNHAQGTERRINIIGSPGRAQFRFAGSAGAFLYTGAASSSSNDRAAICDLKIVHGGSGSSGIVVSGPTILIGSYANNFLLENVGIYDRGAGEAAVNPIEIKSATVKIHRCKFETRTDLAQLVTDGITPVGVLLSTSGAGGGTHGGVEIYDSGIDGCTGRSYGIHFAHPIADLIDTPRVSRCLIKDHLHGIRHSGAGQVYNWVSSDLIIDGISGANGDALHLEPAAGGIFGNGMFTNTWTASIAGAALLLSGANGGTVRDNKFVGGHFANGTTTQVSIPNGNNIINNSFSHIDIMSQVASGYAVNWVAAHGNSMRGCTVQVIGGASGAAFFHSGCTATRIQGNLWVGVDATIGFSNSSHSNKDGNVFTASI